MRLPKCMLRHGGKLAGALLVLLLCLWFLYSQRGNLNREALESFGQGLPITWFLLAFFLLPLCGFPMSVLLVLAGIRFGLGGGMAVVTAGMLFHHYVAFHLTHGWFRNRLRAFLERLGYGIPPIQEKHRVWFTAVFAAIHGPPYFAKLDLLALTDIPFKVYLWAGASVYILFSLIPVAAGSALAHFDPRWLYLILTLGTLLTYFGFWLKRRYRETLPTEFDDTASTPKR